MADTDKGTSSSEISGNDKLVKTDDEWRKILTPHQFHVLREKGTERAFTGEYYASHDQAMYVCAACGQELFGSDREIRLRLGLAQLHRAGGAQQRRGRDRREPRHGPHRGALQPLRRAPRARLSRRPARGGRAALLHQLGVDQGDSGALT